MIATLVSSAVFLAVIAFAQKLITNIVMKSDLRVCQARNVISISSLMLIFHFITSDFSDQSVNEILCGLAMLYLISFLVSYTFITVTKDLDCMFQRIENTQECK